MKKIILAAFALVSSFAVFANDPGVNEKVLEAFNKTFQQAQDVSWSTSGENYQVKFTQNAIASRVYYDKEGNILKTYRYYKEESLPLLIISKVRSRYSEKSIHGVTEVSSENGTYYYIMLEDKTHWMEVKSDSYGSLKVEKKFKKA
jgi:hypothetical protein